MDSVPQSHVHTAGVLAGSGKLGPRHRGATWRWGQRLQRCSYGLRTARHLPRDADGPHWALGSAAPAGGTQGWERPPCPRTGHSWARRGTPHGERKHQPHGSGGERESKGAPRDPAGAASRSCQHEDSHVLSPNSRQSICPVPPLRRRSACGGRPLSQQPVKQLSHFVKLLGVGGVLAASLGQVENAAKSGHVLGQDAISTFAVTNTRNTEGLLCDPTVHSLIRRNTGHSAWV